MPNEAAVVEAPEVDEESAALETSYAETREGPDHGHVAATPAPTPAPAPATAEAAGEAFAREAEVAAPTPAAEEAAKQTQAVLDALTPEEVAQMRNTFGQFTSLKQGMDKLAGTVGSIKQALDQLREIKRTAGPDSAAAAGARKIEAAMLGELAEAYPDLAEKLAPALERVLGATASAAPSGADEATQRRLAAQETAIDRLEKREVERRHPKWEESIAARDESGQVIKDADGKVIPSQVFLGWFGSLPKDNQDQFRNASDADTMNGYLDMWAEHKAKASPPAPAAAPALSAKQRRLQAAVVAQGSPVPAAVGSAPNDSEDDGFMQGFTEVVKARQL